MFARFAMLSALCLGTPAMAESLRDTHHQVSTPAGKSVALFRPIGRNDCAAAANHHQSGKAMLSAARPSEACDRIAARDRARELATADR